MVSIAQWITAAFTHCTLAELQAPLMYAFWITM